MSFLDVLTAKLERAALAADTVTAALKRMEAATTGSAIPVAPTAPQAAAPMAPPAVPVQPVFPVKQPGAAAPVPPVTPPAPAPVNTSGFLVGSNGQRCKPTKTGMFCYHDPRGMGFPMSKRLIAGHWSCSVCQNTTPHQTPAQPLPQAPSPAAQAGPVNVVAGLIHQDAVNAGLCWRGCGKPHKVNADGTKAGNLCSDGKSCKGAPVAP